MNKDRDIRLMGILNLTGDSFFAGSRLLTAEGRLDEALFRARAERMLSEGADILDLGAVSTRPGAPDVSEEEEWRRLAPALHILREEFSSARISVDTTRSGIVRKAFDITGPFIVNDISAGEDDSMMIETAAGLHLTYVAMHKRGTPATMQSLAVYPEGVVAAVRDYFRRFADRADSSGLTDWILDPGFGFAKTVEQNYELLGSLSEFRDFGRPVLVGVSRKSMIYRPLGITPDGALAPTQVVHYMALEAGADILRVHDVAPASQTVALYRLASDPSAASLTAAMRN